MDDVRDAIRDGLREGLREEAAPLNRRVAEVRGLANGTIRRLDALQGDLAAEREARIDDLEVLVDLLAAGFRGVNARLDRIEAAIAGRVEAEVYPLRRADTG
jgi:hypothetical protein